MPLRRFKLEVVENYFNYFTEIEEHFQRRRGSILLLNTLDWALIETWKDAGIPLEAVLRGIDESFDKYDQRPSKSRKVNSLAYCAQEVLAAAEEMKQAAAGTAPSPESKPARDTGFEGQRIATFLRANADALAKNSAPVARQMADDIRLMAADIDTQTSPKLEDVERRLTMMEEKLVASLMAGAKDEDLVAIRAEADRELAPYRRKMPAAQIDHLQRQFMQKRLLEKAGIPRLSLFYL
ncbi:MAG TPA: hypothetical protein VN577_06305 [Terriglobales bacterium]|nr:hypothetical protein [Terriglobales bacterium]